MIITENCGTCDHSTGKTRVLAYCKKLKVDVVKDTLEQGCPLPAINGRIIVGNFERRGK